MKVTLNVLNPYSLRSISWMLLFVACQPNNRESRVEAVYYKIDTLQYANGFKSSVSAKSTCIEVSNPWQHAKNIHFEYHISTHDSLSKTIHIPVKRVICLSTTHLAYIHLLGEDESIVGVTNPKLISNPVIAHQIKKGATVDIGNEQSLNYEVILNLKPDVIFAYGVGAEVQGIYQKFAEWGIPVVMVAEYLETTPLAKAEWIKFFGLFYNKKPLADSLFNSIDFSYNNLILQVKHIDKKPVVLTSMPWKDIWYVPGGKSFMAKFINDAGGKYIWEDDTSRESLALSIESVFFKANQAEIWIHTGMANSLDDIQGTDPRMSQLKPFIEKKVFNNNRQSNINKGNDFWESGAVYPHLILNDLIHIFHPNIITDSNMYYYQQLK